MDKCCVPTNLLPRQLLLVLTTSGQMVCLYMYSRVCYGMSIPDFNECLHANMAPCLQAYTKTPLMHIHTEAVVRNTSVWDWIWTLLILIYSAKWPIVFCDVDGHEDGNTGTQKSGKDSKSNKNEAAQVVGGTDCHAHMHSTLCLRLLIMPIKMWTQSGILSRTS